MAVVIMLSFITYICFSLATAKSKNSISKFILDLHQKCTNVASIIESSKYNRHSQIDVKLCKKETSLPGMRETKKS